MDVRTALVQLRSELNMRQVDLANELGISVITLNRWENEKCRPSRAMSLAIMSVATAHSASMMCRTALREALIAAPTESKVDSLKFATVEQINNLVNDSSNGVIVSDALTHDILYANRQMSVISGKPLEMAVKHKCYEYIFGKGQPCEFCKTDTFSDTEFTTGEYASDKTGRFYMSRGKIIEWGEKKAHIEYITDLTKLQKTSKALERSQTLTSLACKEAGMWMFSLDIADGTAHIEPIVQKSLGLPAAVPNFINYLAEHHVSSEESIAELLQTIPKLKQGSASVEITLQTNFASKKTHWVRFRATTAEYDKYGNPTTAICSAQQIDNEKALQASIRFEHERILGSRNDLMGYTISNLTKNTVVEHHHKLDIRSELQAGISYDEAIRTAIDSIEPEQDKLRYLETHNRENLLANFRNGTLGSTLEFQLMQPEKGLIWVNDTLKLMLQPLTGDVMLYEYCFFSHSKIVMEGLLAGAAQNEYEQFGSISMITGQMTRINFAKGFRSHNLEFVPYEENRMAYCTKSVVPGMQEEFLKKTSLQTVQNELKKCKTYRITFQVSENGKHCTKAAQFTWYDENRLFCLFSLMDLTKFMETLEHISGPDAGVQDDNT